MKLELLSEPLHFASFMFFSPSLSIAETSEEREESTLEDADPFFLAPSRIRRAKKSNDKENSG